MVIQTDNRDTERKVLSILKVLSQSPEPLGSTAIARALKEYGLAMAERTVRYHLRITDERGYTQPMGRDGRMLTREGQAELRSALIPEQVGFIISKIELLAFNTSFDPNTGKGQVVVNTSIYNRDSFKAALAAMRDAFKAGLCVSDLVAVGEPGEKLGDVVVPQEKMGLATLCSITINGVLLKSGIPMDSRFGGVLQLRHGRPSRFVAIIDYSGSSLDPSEAYIRARMTNVREAALSGNGSILANFREIPAPSRQLTEDTISKLLAWGIGGTLRVGEPSEPVCQIPVGLNRAGIVLLGGLNPVAAAEEAGIQADNMAMAGMMDFSRLSSFWKL